MQKNTPPPFISSDAILKRIARAQASLAAHNYDALIISAGVNLHYFAGIPWSATERAVLLVITTSGETWMVCPHFELGSLEDCIRIQVETRSWQEEVDPAYLALSGLPNGAQIALDPEMSFRLAHSFKAARPDLNFKDGSIISDPLRAVKTPNEIALIQHAMSITDAVHKATFEQLKPGQRASDIKRFIDEAHRYHGADNGSLFCAVQFGHATAYPHGIQGDQVLGENELILIDTGCRIDGYHSDITRTYAFGRSDPEHQRIWSIEKEAQHAAFAAAQCDAPCASVDNAARALLERYGLGPDYQLPGLPHRTGHGIGLAIHEAPYLVRGQNTLLQPGHCCSIEPMIVVPKTFGIRLEDHFYMTENGPKWFTNPAHSFEEPFA